jgi:hypothetical protein
MIQAFGNVEMYVCGEIGNSLREEVLVAECIAKVMK